MTIVRIQGGLGNQMFCYAYAKALQNKGNQVKIDISEYQHYKLHGGYQLSHYELDLDIATVEDVAQYYRNTIFDKVLHKLSIHYFDFDNRIMEKTLAFDEELLRVKDDSFVQGYFQNENYFKDIRVDILNDFTFCKPLSDYSAKIEQEIKATKVACSLHIRRGDYTKKQNISIHGVCSLEYYQRAIQHMLNECPDTTFFVFSDDMAWVKANLPINNACYVGSEAARLPHEDIHLMQLCHHNIIANSSFSWWGAWLNQYDEKIVIAPKEWFQSAELKVASQNIPANDWLRL